MEFRPIRLLPLKRSEVEVDRKVALDPGQIARKERLRAILLERLALRGLLHFVEMLVDGIEGPELLDERLRAFLADAGHAGNVVDCIAPDGHHVDHLLRGQPERFLHSSRVVKNFASGVVEADPFTDQLKEVFVGGCDHYVVAAIPRRAGERPDQIVGFPVRHPDHWDAQPVEDFVHQRQLHDQVVGHRLPIFLVVGEGLVPFFGSADIEGHSNAIGVVILEQLAQHLGESVHRVGGQARRVGQATDRKVGAVDVVGTVDDEQSGTLRRHGGGL